MEAVERVKHMSRWDIQTTINIDDLMWKPPRSVDVSPAHGYPATIYEVTLRILEDIFQNN